MTADVELLPLPEVVRYAVAGDVAYPVYEDAEGQYVDYDDHVSAMHAYARANVAHATAAKDAEIEALRAERDAAFRMSRCECASDECCANLVKHQLRAERLAEEVEALRAEVERSERYAEQSERERLWAEARAERLAEALRNIAAMRWSSGEDLMDAAGAARAALEQEAGRE